MPVVNEARARAARERHRDRGRAHYHRGKRGAEMGRDELLEALGALLELIARIPPDPDESA